MRVGFVGVVMVFMLFFNVSSLSLMFYVVGILGLFCPELSLLMFGLNGGRICLDCWGFVFVFGWAITS